MPWPYSIKVKDLRLHSLKLFCQRKVNSLFDVYTDNPCIDISTFNDDYLDPLKII